MFNFPETLAAHTLLTRMGYSPDDIFCGRCIDPSTGEECMGISVRRSGVRNGFSIALDALPVATGAATGAERLLVKDCAAWNATSQEFREAHLGRSEVRKRAIEILSALVLRGLPPRESP